MGIQIPPNILPQATNIRTAISLQKLLEHGLTFQIPKESYPDEILIKADSIYKDIFIINTQVNSIGQKDQYYMPLIYSDSRIAFQAKTVDWIDIWRNLTGKYGKLSAQTIITLDTHVFFCSNLSIISSTTVTSHTYSGRGSRMN